MLFITVKMYFVSQILLFYFNFTVHNNVDTIRKIDRKPTYYMLSISLWHLTIFNMQQKKNSRKVSYKAIY